MKQGRRWVAIDSAIFLDPIVGDGPLCESAAWIWMITAANWRDNQQHDPPLRRGQILVRPSMLVREWRWQDRKNPTQDVRNLLRRWERGGKITMQQAKGSRRRGSIVTLVAYDPWQSPGRDESNFVPQSQPNGGLIAPQSRPDGSERNQAVTEQKDQSCPDGALVVPQSRSTQLQYHPTKHQTPTLIDLPPCNPTPQTGGGGDPGDSEFDELELMADQIAAMGRTEDGKGLYVEFDGPPGEPVTKALRAAGFAFRDRQWRAKRSDERRALLHRINPDGHQILNLDDAPKAEPAAQAPAPSGVSDEHVEAFRELLEARSGSGWSLLRLIEVEAVTEHEGKVWVQFATASLDLSSKLNARREGKPMFRDELASLWSEVTGQEAVAMPVRYLKLAADNGVVDLGAERQRRAS